MTKEETFELLKWVILQLRDNSDKLRDDPAFSRDWLAKQNYLKSCVNALSDDDKQWMDSQYSVWHKKEILPHVNPKLFNQNT